MNFDENYWRKVIGRPDWYVDFFDFANQAHLETQADEPAQEKLNKQIRHFFEDALASDQVSLGRSGQDFDSERQPVDTVVIHHTSAKPDYRLSYLNAVQLLNIYVPAYAQQYKGQPIWSGHFQGGRQIFWGYHWLMRLDGNFEHLLDDNQIGWHAGNWEINRRSIGICLDNDYEKQDPTDENLRKLADFIKEKYPGIKLIGHREARRGTVCPGKNFLDGWKPILLSYLK